MISAADLIGKYAPARLAGGASAPASAGEPTPAVSAAVSRLTAEANRALQETFESALTRNASPFYESTKLTHAPEWATSLGEISRPIAFTREKVEGFANSARFPGMRFEEARALRQIETWIKEQGGSGRYLRGAEDVPAAYPEAQALLRKLTFGPDVEILGFHLCGVFGLQPIIRAPKLQAHFDRHTDKGEFGTSGS